MNATDLFALLSLAAFLSADLWLWLSGRATVSARVRYWGTFHPLLWRAGYVALGAFLYHHFWR